MLMLRSMNLANYEELAALGIGQRKIEALLAEDPHLVDAWIIAIRKPPTNIKNPVGWMLAAIKAGETPPSPHATLDSQRQQQIRNAENWIRNVGHCFPSEDQHLIEAHLFDDRGIIRNNRDPQLRQRLLDLWRNA